MEAHTSIIQICTFTAPSYWGPALAESTFCWRMLMRKHHKALCDSAKLRCASGKAEHFPLASVVVRRPTGAGRSNVGVGEGRRGSWIWQGRVEWGGDRVGRGRSGAEGQGIGCIGVHHIQNPNPGLLCLLGSIWTYTSSITYAVVSLILIGLLWLLGHTNVSLSWWDLQQPKIPHKIQWNLRWHHCLTVWRFR